MSEGRAPGLAFETSGEAFLVFEQQETGAATRIVGRRLDQAADPLGVDLPLSAGAGINAAVAFEGTIDTTELSVESTAVESTAGVADGKGSSSSGAFLSVWEDLDDESSKILGQLSNEGALLGLEQALSDRATDQTRPDVEARSSGGFLVVWESQQESAADSVPLGGSKGGKASAGSDDNESGIFGRLVNILGRAEGTELRLNSAQLEDPARPAVAADGSGQLLVVWDDPRSAGSENRKIVGQLVSEEGELLGDELRLSRAKGSQIEPDVSFDAEIERYLVVWRQLDSVEGGIGGRIFDADGEPLEEEVPDR